jgi:hypothetical protein
MARLEMMAIGDSLYQGVRSMTIRADLCATSIPAQVAKALGIPFASPDMAHPVIIDPEAWLADLGRIGKDLAAYGAYWQGNPVSPGGHVCFDNVSVGGAQVWHLYRYTALDAANDAKAQFDKLAGKPLGIGTLGGIDVAGLIFGATARFVLNPSNNPEYQQMTQLDWVALRKPKRLLVDIGSNNGLWDMCFNGDPASKFYFGKDYQATSGDPDDFTQIEELADALNRLPPEIEVIYYNNQGRPRCVPNLMPLPDMVEWETHPGEGYFDLYENRMALSMTYNRMTGAQMKALDDYVARINDKIQQIVSSRVTSRKVVFVDLYKVLSDNDAKHYGDKRATMAGGKRISNNMFESDPWGGMAHGGFFGLDGMHPTNVGYAKVAQQVIEDIYANEFAGRPAPVIDLDAVSKRDTLIQDCPGKWTPLMYLWRDIRRGASKSSDTGLQVIDAMKAGNIASRVDWKSGI